MNKSSPEIDSISQEVASETIATLVQVPRGLARSTSKQARTPEVNPVASAPRSPAAESAIPISSPTSPAAASCQVLEDFAKLSASIPKPCLTPEESKAIASAQEAYERWQAVRAEYSHHGRERKKHEIRLRMRECPSKVAGCVAELSQLDTNAEIVCDEARYAMVREVVAILPTIRAAYERELAQFEAFIQRIEAIDVSPFGLSSEPLLGRLAATKARLTSSLQATQEEPGLTLGPIRSPADLARGLRSAE